MTLQPQQLNNTIQISPNSHILILNSAADPYLPTIAQHLTIGAITLAEDNIASLHEAESKLLPSSNLRHIPFHEYTLKEPPSTIDIALLNLLYQPSKAWIIYGLQLAAYALKPGARLYVIGAKDRGILSIAKHMEKIFGNAETLLISKGHRIVSSHKIADTTGFSFLQDTGGALPVQDERSDSHWGRDPLDRVPRVGGHRRKQRTPSPTIILQGVNNPSHISPTLPLQHDVPTASNPTSQNFIEQFTLDSPQISKHDVPTASSSKNQNFIEQFTLNSPQISEHNDESPAVATLLTALYGPTVFARGNLDEGTRLLIEALEVQPTDESLDIGCGAGYIGLHIARLASKGRVTMVDVSLATVDLARQYIATSGLTNIHVLPSDGAQAVLSQRFDLVVTNPPFHQGGIQTTAIAERFIQQASQVLRPNGRFYLVANRFLKYEPTLNAHFKTINEIAGNTRFKILRALPHPR
jgi:16S rRNA G1207 methylase RsmC